MCARASVCVRALWRWDLEPAPVCRRVAELLRRYQDEPILCLATINSKLFDQVRRGCAVSVPARIRD